MEPDINKQFGNVISDVICGKDLSEEESFQAFSRVLNNEVNDMQQGAFLAALTTKGETADEIAGGWKAIYHNDTNKITIECNDHLIDNCGTGMDSFKTFNISTAASLIAAAGELKIARHGARAISSKSGTVDISEHLGVDVECPVEMVGESIVEAGVGLFNGMSPAVHPNALGRILSQISFGSPLNIAASLANPAHPKKAVRGVYSKKMMEPVADVMQKIGYEEAIIVHGTVAEKSLGIDEASVCGTTHYIHVRGSERNFYTFNPEDVGLESHKPMAIAALSDPTSAIHHMLTLLSGSIDNGAADSVCLNSALLFLVGDKVSSIKEGIELSKEILFDGKALDTLERWVKYQNRDPQEGLKRLHNHMNNL